jgi:hypothetical protein
MPIQRLSDEQLHHLTPEERIKYLRALEAEQKAQAEEAKRKADEEIRAAEELIKRSQEEIEEEEIEEEERERKNAKKEPAKEERKQESIDDLLGGERAAAQANGQYRTDRPDYTIPGQERTASPLYATLETAAQELERLAGKNSWDPNDQRMYSDAKQNIERAGQYQLSGERLQEELGLAQHALNRLKYQH